MAVRPDSRMGSVAQRPILQGRSVLCRGGRLCRSQHFGNTQPRPRRRLGTPGRCRPPQHPPAPIHRHCDVFRPRCLCRCSPRRLRTVPSRQFGSPSGSFADLEVPMTARFRPSTAPTSPRKVPMWLAVGKNGALNHILPTSACDPHGGHPPSVRARWPSLRTRQLNFERYRKKRERLSVLPWKQPIWVCRGVKPNGPPELT